MQCITTQSARGRAIFLTVMGTVVCVLLIASSNGANLLRSRNLPARG
jgi:hypothetical protein